ncbi:MAG: hypothetical protein IT232_09505 [Flavobacteriales bacterium]|nr:hypothetical protein [Flavobacteriales bacterium]
MAMLFVLAHALISHVHESQATLNQDISIHKSENSSFFDFLSYLFHEYTDEGDMENFIVRSSFENNVDFINLFSFDTFFDFNFGEIEKIIPIKQYKSNFNTSPTFSGFFNSIGVRPPPLTYIIFK